MQIECEVLKVEAKKNGLDKVIKIVLETTNEQALLLQEYIAKDTVKLEVKHE